MIEITKQYRTVNMGRAVAAFLEDGEKSMKIEVEPVNGYSDIEYLVVSKVSDAGNDFIDIRIFGQNGQNDVIPTHRGVTFPIDMISAVIIGLKDHEISTITGE